MQIEKRVSVLRLVRELSSYLSLSQNRSEPSLFGPSGSVRQSRRCLDSQAVSGSTRQIQHYYDSQAVSGSTRQSQHCLEALE